MKKINLAISGCLGRMGQQLIKSSKSNKNFKLVALTENKPLNKKIAGIKLDLNTDRAFKNADVIIDFTVPKAWEKGQKAVKEGKMDDARDYFDMGIAMVACYSDETNQYADETIIESKTRKLWLMRFWKVGLENNNLLLG